MRRVYLDVIILFVLATLIVAVQNLESVTVSFRGFRAAAPPLAMLTILIYIIGALTGGSLLALLRHANLTRGRNGAWAVPDNAGLQVRSVLVPWSRLTSEAMLPAPNPGAGEAPFARYSHFAR